jgi:hypothetical protein
MSLPYVDEALLCNMREKSLAFRPRQKLLKDRFDLLRLGDPGETDATSAGW